MITKPNPRKAARKAARKRLSAAIMAPIGNDWDIKIAIDQQNYQARCKEFANRSAGQKNRKRKKRSNCSIMPLYLGYTQ